MSTIDDLVKEAAAAFQSLSPADQERVMQEQSASWARGEMAMGETSTMTPPGPRPTSYP